MPPQTAGFSNRPFPIWHQASAELSRISQITKQVLSYHRESKQPVQTRANELLEGALAMFQAHIAERGIDLVIAALCDQQVKPVKQRRWVVVPKFHRLHSTLKLAFASNGAKLVDGRVSSRCASKV
jgi:hypothetical protein